MSNDNDIKEAKLALDAKQVDLSMYLNKIDPSIVEDGHIISVSKAEEMFPGTKIVGRYGNRGVVSSITPENRTPSIGIEGGDKAELILSPVSVYNRIGYELKLLTTLCAAEPGYYPAKHIDTDFFRDVLAGVVCITRKKTNTRQERRIMRRAKKALDLKRVNKVVYTLWRPNVYLVEGVDNFTLPEKGTRKRDILDSYLGQMGIGISDK